MTNIGRKPTIEEKVKRVTVETYKRDFHENVYGVDCIVDLPTFRRPEKKFENLGGAPGADGPRRFDGRLYHGNQVNYGKSRQQHHSHRHAGIGKEHDRHCPCKALRYSFIDGDILIQNRTGTTPGDYMEKYGNESFLKLENEVNAGISCERTVIAPGGSICYATDAPQALQTDRHHHLPVD